MSIQKKLLWAGLGALGFATAISLLIVLFGQFSEVEVKLLLSTVTLGVETLLVAAFLYGYEKIVDSWFLRNSVSSIGLLVSLAGAGMMLELLWRDWNNYAELPSKEYIDTTVVLGVFSLALAYVSLLLRAWCENVFARVLVVFSSSAAVVVAFMVSYVVVRGYPYDLSEFFFRIMAACTIVGAATGIGVPVVKRLMR